jgi:DNA-binding NtrC family response regulator
MTRKTILIVDDEEIVRKLVRVALHGFGEAEFLEAHDAAEALEICQAHHGAIDLLLSDVLMPGELNGAQMAEKFYEIHPEARILLMSGYEAQALRLNPRWDFIQKPFAASEIRDTIYRVLGLEISAEPGGRRRGEPLIKSRIFDQLSYFGRT